MAHSPEFQLLLACNSGRGAAELCSGGVHWQSVLALVEKHGLAGLAYQQLRGLAPAQVAERLRLLALELTLQSLRQLSELETVLRAFHHAGIAALPWKGPVLALRLYGKTSARTSSDLDLLIHYRDREAASRVMQGLGYQLNWPANPRHRSPVEYVFESEGRSPIELRWSLSEADSAVDVTLEVLWPRLRAMALPPEELLVLLSAHGAKHLWSRLAWLCDIAQLLRRYPELDWTRVPNVARELGQQRTTGLALLLANQLLGSKCEVKADRPLRILAGIARRQLEAGKLDPWRHYGFQVLTPDRRAERWRRFLRLLLRRFHPTRQDVEYLPLPAWLQGLYLIVRPFRLLMTHALPVRQFAARRFRRAQP